MTRSAVALLLLIALCACGADPRPSGAAPTAKPPSAPSVVKPLRDDSVPLAVTLDDLPFVGPTVRGESVKEALGRIVDLVQRERVPTTGFVTCSRMAPGALAPWLDAKLPVGNHSTAHKSVDELGHDAFVADVKACRERLEATAGEAPVYFRYPFLQTGATRELRDETAASIAALPHRMAPVSIDTSDWALAEAYAKARDAGDEQRATDIADAYVAHVQRAARHYRRVARDRVGREVAQVLLLHANSLAADHLGRVLGMLRSEGFRFVALDEALGDAVYAERDDWVDPVGASWLLRIPPADPETWGWDRGQQHALQLRFGVRKEENGRIGPALSARKLDGVPAWLVLHEKPIPANSLVYLTPGGDTVLASTPMTPAATEHLLDWIAARFGKLPALAAASHFHFDGAAGIGPLQDAGVPVAVSDLTARLLLERGPKLQEGMVEMFGDAFRGWHIAAPKNTYPIDKGYSATIGGTEVQVIYPGPGHAPDNVVTFFPATGVMFGGCMVKGGDDLGFTGDADLGAWPASMLRLEALHPKLVIPGHGERIDPEQLAHTRALLEKHGRAK